MRTELGEVLAKPQFSHVVIVCDETYHDLVFSDDKSLFLNVNKSEAFLKRTFVVTSMAKALAGCPGLRLGIVYAPDMVIENKPEAMGPKFGVFMMDTSCAVSTPVQYVAECILKAKLGEGNPKWISIHQHWEKGILEAYSSTSRKASQLFTKDSSFPLVTPSEGAFFAVVSGAKLIGKKVPQEIKVLDGRVVTDLPKKVGSALIENDIHITLLLLHAAEVSVVPGSGFIYAGTVGLLRLSLANSPEVLEKALARMENCAQQVFRFNAS